jgi:DnaK suppressor protein
MTTPKDRSYAGEKEKKSGVPMRRSVPSGAALSASSGLDAPGDAVPKEKMQFFSRQRERLLILKDTLLDSMRGVGRDSLRSRAEGSEASAFGMHQADAGSDAYDRDFSLSLLSQEQDSLYEIDQALKRIENGTYGLCEICGKTIPQVRLEALPFARYTIECQAELERRGRLQRIRQPVSSLFGLVDEEGNEVEEEESTDNKE